jgi:hypothetical protein
MSHAAILNKPRPWAFGRSELTAGLRRHAGDPSLRIDDLEEKNLPNRWPSLARMRGIEVTGKGATGEYSFSLVLKESLQQGITRAGTASPGQREVAFYRNLTDQIPVRVPEVIAFDPLGEWLVMSQLGEGRHPEAWTKEDYLLATTQLAVLHDRFWGLGHDLSVYTWLHRPLDSDFEVNVKVAGNAITRLELEPDTGLLSHDPHLLDLFRRMVTHAPAIVQMLQRAPQTLLHGDFWPGNIHVDQQGRLTVYDWQQTGIGPGMLDLQNFVQTSLWWFNPLPVSLDEIVATYRYNLSEKTGTIWANREWQALMDHALMWIFLVNWLDTLVSTPHPLISTRIEQLEDIWLEPLRAAVRNRLPEA